MVAKYHLEPENDDEVWAQENKNRKFGCSCGLGCVGVMILLFFIAIYSIEPHESSRLLQCCNNEKQIMLALHTYYDAHHRSHSFPPAYSTDVNGKPLHSWRVLILPFLEQGELYEQIRLDEPWDSEYNRQFHNKMPSCYWCNSASSHRAGKAGMTCYMRVVGTGTTTDGPGTIEIKLNEIKGRLSEIVALVEVYPTVNWMAPVDISPEQLAAGIDRKKKLGIGSYHYGKINVAMLDGSATTMTENEVPSLVEKVIIPNDIEILFEEK